MYQKNMTAGSSRECAGMFDRLLSLITSLSFTKNVAKAGGNDESRHVVEKRRSRRGGEMHLQQRFVRFAGPARENKGVIGERAPVYTYTRHA